MTSYHNRGQDTTFVCKRKIVLTLVVFLCVLVGWCFVRQNYTNCERSTESEADSSKEDWFDGNITEFQNKANIYNYVVIRKTTIEAHGDFSCSSSIKPKMCVYKVETLVQAVQKCNVYADVCAAFVLTRDMNVRLKHQVRRLNYDNQAVTLVKSAFVSRTGNVPSAKLFKAANKSRLLN